MAARKREYLYKPVYRYKFDTENCQGILIDKFVKILDGNPRTLYTEDEGNSIQLKDPKGKLIRNLEEFDLRTRSMLSHFPNKEEEFLKEFKKYILSQKEEIITTYNSNLEKINRIINALEKPNIIRKYSAKINLKEILDIPLIEETQKFFKGNIESSISQSLKYKTGEIVKIGDICIVERENILPYKKELVQVVAIYNDQVSFVNNCGSSHTTNSAFDFLKFVCRKEDLA